MKANRRVERRWKQGIWGLMLVCLSDLFAVSVFGESPMPKGSGTAPWGILLGAALAGVLLYCFITRRTSPKTVHMEQKLDILLETIDQAVAICDREGHLTVYNGKYREYSGLEDTYLQTRPSFTEIMDRWAKVNATDPETLQRQREILTAQTTARLNLKHHGRVYEMQHLPMASGGFVRTYTDITERWNLEEQLRRDEQKFRDLLMDLPSAITITSEKDGTLLYMNQAALEITGTSAPVALGRSAAGFWEHPEDRKEFVRQVLEKGAVTSFNTRLVKKDGSLFWVSISSKRTVFEGQPVLFSIFMDIDERKRMDEALLETEKRFRNILAQSPGAFMISRVDDGRMLFVNESARRLLKLGEDYEPYQSYVATEFYGNPAQREKLLERLAAQGAVRDMELELIDADGSRMWVLLGAVLTEFEGIPCVLSALTDITERKNMETALKESETRHRLLADNATDVIWTMDREGRFTYVSPSVEKLRGYTAEEVKGQSFMESLTPEYVEVVGRYFGQAMQEVASGRPVTPVNLELQQPCKNGPPVWTEVSAGGLYNEQGEFIGILGVTRNIQERKQTEQAFIENRTALEVANRSLEELNRKLERMAATDQLTQAWNRRQFEQSVRIEMSRAQRYQLNLSLLMFDIDHFKDVNDRYGHVIGDAVLVELSTLVRQKIRIMDSLTRWGGEEFVVLAPELGLKEAESMAEKLRLLIEAHLFPEAGMVTVSIGVASYRRGETLDEWIRKADHALYEAKKNGRNRVSIFDDAS